MAFLIAVGGWEGSLLCRACGVCVLGGAGLASGSEEQRQLEELRVWP